MVASEDVVSVEVFDGEVVDALDGGPVVGRGDSDPMAVGFAQLRADAEVFGLAPLPLADPERVAVGGLGSEPSASSSIVGPRRRLRGSGAARWDAQATADATLEPNVRSLTRVRRTAGSHPRRRGDRLPWTHGVGAPRPGRAPTPAAREGQHVPRVRALQSGGRATSDGPRHARSSGLPSGMHDDGARSRRLRTGGPAAGSPARAHRG